MVVSAASPTKVLLVIAGLSLAVSLTACSNQASPSPVGAPSNSGAGGIASGGVAAINGGSPDGGSPNGGSPNGGSSGGSVVVPGTGLLWPPDHSFPTFAPIDQLEVISGGSPEQDYLYLSLQGLINRKKTRIHLQDGAPEGPTFWLDKLNVPKTAVRDPLTLITKYRSEIAGIVIYDAALIDTVNLATTIAGIEGGLVAPPSLAPMLSTAPYNLPVLADLRTNHFASANAVYQYELSTYGSKASTRLIIGLDPTLPRTLRDYAVATQAMVVWLDPRDATQKGILDGFLSRLAPNSPYAGWWPDEGSGVNLASQHGIPTFAADFATNLTVLGAVPYTIKPPAPPPTPTLANQAYVAIFMSDGDNLQENEHLMVLKWTDPNRGKVPIAWTVQPALVDAAPIILNYYWTTATPNDVLVSGPSGLGYTYPAAWPALSLNDYTTRTASYLTRAGLRIITVWNGGSALSGAPATSYVANMPHLLGVTDQAGAGGLKVLDSKLPQLSFASGYAATETALETEIDVQLKGWSKSGPLFVAVQGDMNQTTINPTTFLAVQQHYASNKDVLFVRADHLFSLIRQARGLPTDP